MCGIFGIITPKPRKFDLRAFCVLGVNNDSRGGDSCGVFIDKKYEYGVNEFKFFYNFFPRSKVLNSVTKCQVALGHCRKASVGANGGPRGDIYIEFKVKDHEIYQREGKDVYFKIPLTITEAVLGVKKEVPTIHGTIIAEIPAGTQNGDKFKFRGKGVDDEKSGKKGDAYGIVSIIIPTKIDRKQKELFKSLSETSLDKSTEFTKYKKYID